MRMVKTIIVILACVALLAFASYLLVDSDYLTGKAVLETGDCEKNCEDKCLDDDCLMSCLDGCIVRERNLLNEITGIIAD